MERKVCQLLFLVICTALPVGCASQDSADDTTSAPALEPATNPMPEHDESHGWGANVQNVSGAGGQR